LGYTASSLYLFEHVIWSFINQEAEWPIDREVFERWVIEGGLVGIIEEVTRASGQREERVAMDKRLVFGSGRKIVNGATLMPYVPSSQTVAIGRAKL
jgi:hypothetical protein